MVLIHYEGHKSRYDEWIAAGSPRLAPYRSRTSRPLSVNMQSVQKLVKGMPIRCAVEMGGEVGAGGGRGGVHAVRNGIGI